LEIKNGKAKNQNIKLMTKINNSRKMEDQFKNIKLSKRHRFEFDKKKKSMWNDRFYMKQHCFTSQPPKTNHKHTTLVHTQTMVSFFFSLHALYFPFPFSFLQCPRKTLLSSCECLPHTQPLHTVTLQNNTKYSVKGQRNYLGHIVNYCKGFRLT
jgi:hypothetical protein